MIGLGNVDGSRKYFEDLLDAVFIKKDRYEFIFSPLSSLDRPDRKIDELWAKEVESRIEAYERGEIKSVALEKVLKRYR